MAGIGLGVTAGAAMGDRDAPVGAHDGMVHAGEVVTVLVSWSKMKTESRLGREETRFWLTLLLRLLSPVALRLHPPGRAGSPSGDEDSHRPAVRRCLGDGRAGRWASVGETRCASVPLFLHPSSPSPLLLLRVYFSLHCCRRFPPRLRHPQRRAFLQRRRRRRHLLARSLARIVRRSLVVPKGVVERVRGDGVEGDGREADDSVEAGVSRVELGDGEAVRDAFGSC